MEAQPLADRLLLLMAKCHALETMLLDQGERINHVETDIQNIRHEIKELHDKDTD